MHCTENYKTVMKEIEADKNKEKGRKGNKSKYTKNIADFLQQILTLIQIMHLISIINIVLYTFLEFQFYDKYWLSLEKYKYDNQ